MKKFFTVFFILCILYSSSLAKEMTLTYDGASHIYTGPSITLKLNGNTFAPDEKLMPPVIIDNRTLVPAREVFEAIGGSVTWNQEDRTILVEIEKNKILLTLDKAVAIVNDKSVELDVPAKLINSKTMVPVRFISENCGLSVEWDDTTKTVSVSKAAIINNIKEVTAEVINGITSIKIKTDAPIIKYNIFNLTEPNRIILDLYDSKFDFNYETISLENNNIQNIRFGVQENNVNRIVIDVTELKEYNTVLSENKTELSITFGENTVVPDEPTNENPATGEEPIENEEENNSNDEEVIVDLKAVTSIKFSPSTKKTTVTFDNIAKYTVSTLSSPDRIIFDFENSVLNVDIPKEIDPSDTIIDKIRFSQKDESTVRIVFDVKCDAKYTVTENDKEIGIKLVKPGYKNVKYDTSGTFPKIILAGADLGDLKRTQSKSSEKYTITYSSSKFKSGSGTIEIDDDFIEKIVISSTKITVYDKGSVNYIAKQIGQDVVITIKDVDASNNKVIVIDPGHGGKDPGAVNGTNYEKTFNLDIALKLYDLLNECEGIDVYMTRNKDIYIDKYQRAEVASDVGADLFVSIHNNSLDNKSYDGTMVLYSAKDADSNYNLTSKEFAQIVHDELIDKLETTDRKIVNRDDLHVLSQTDMPAILCEVVFVSNDSDLARLKKESFREDVAEAIYDGIQKAISEF